VTTRADIVNAARAYLGVRWHHQGRSRAGIDCIGLAVAVARDVGFTVQDVTDYGRIPDGQRLRQGLLDHMQSVDRAWAPGDVLLMRFERYPVHVGIASDVGLIHAYAQMRRVVEHRMDDTWRGRVLQAFRFPGVA